MKPQELVGRRLEDALALWRGQGPEPRLSFTRPPRGGPFARWRVARVRLEPELELTLVPEALALEDVLDAAAKRG